MVDQSKFISELLQKGFARHKPRTATWKTAIVCKNAARQTLFVMFSTVGIDFKIYLEAMELEFDERGLLFTRGGEFKRFRYDTFTEASDLHQFVREAVGMFMESANISLEHAFNPGGRAMPAESWCKLCLFGLDGVLLETTGLGEFREGQYLEKPGDIPGFKMGDQYNVALLARFGHGPDRSIYTVEHLAVIKKNCPTIRFGILTSSPRHYVRTLLARVYPGFDWDVIIANEDLECEGSLVSGISLAMQRVGVADSANVICVGITENYLEAAFDAGCWAALEMSGFPPSLENEHYRLRERAWDGLLKGYQDLIGVINRPWAYLPELDAVSLNGKENYKPRRLKARYQDPISSGEATTVHALGRYFAGSRRNRAAWHGLTAEMLEFKRSASFPQTWLTVLRTAVKGIAHSRKSSLVITVIPAKVGSHPRMEMLLAALASELGSYYDCEYIDDVLEFGEGVKSTHLEKVGKAQRFYLAQRFLAVKKPEQVKGRDIVLIDDIVTSGASLVSARLLLVGAGAATVTCMALAQAITERPQ